MNLHRLSGMFRAKSLVSCLLPAVMLSACAGGLEGGAGAVEGKQQEWARAVHGLTRSEPLTSCFAAAMGAVMLDAGIIQLYPDADAAPGAYTAMWRVPGTLRARPVSIRLDAFEPFALLRNSGTSYDVLVPYSPGHDAANRTACDELVAHSQAVLLRLNAMEKGEQ